MRPGVRYRVCGRGEVMVGVVGAGVAGCSSITRFSFITRFSSASRPWSPELAGP